jgi:6-pyruvoyltetrahydropterin/6-carboxytetrahydropterin synthase
MIIGKTFTFDAAHLLPGHEKCGIMHGHTWKVTVEVDGPVNPKTGMVMDFTVLTELVGGLLRLFDHNVLNNFLDVPTCENLCAYLAGALHGLLNNTEELPRFGGRENPMITVIVQEGEGGYARLRTY